MRSRPSAVRRTRLQSAQNGSETGLMKPIRPCAVGEAVDAGGRAGLARLSGSSGYTASIAARISAPVSTWSGVQARSASSGMNSMKRTW